ncbi:hypothetical protein BACCIP111895_04531 [Neobacillus rhizosphaerae]|uniref:Uncharacterized protein n=1 Tax=Neobacillus rhizosphaerae TaxID=2880965 RepID=A0ABN8KU27_9BACI|nr:hypothetical protein BACCIP111895_04531 [Neobacillus rhizosphaerae]
MVIYAEALHTISIVILIICSSFYLRHLVKTKKQRKLSAFEFTMYTTIQMAYIFFAISLLISIFVK